MKEKKYILWTTASGVTCMGIIEEEKDNKIIVKNPVSIVFYTETSDSSEDKIKTKLRWDIIPFVFGSLITPSDSLWEINAPDRLISDNEINEELIYSYDKTILVCSSNTNNKE